MIFAPTHIEGLPEDTKGAFSVLKNISSLQDGYLAGGTALALWFGHRISRDLDFFSETGFHGEALLEELSRQGKFSLEKKDPDTIQGNLEGVKVAFFRYPYPFLDPLVFYDGVAIASVADISCMKLDAIASRGTKRDFFDVYFAMENGFSLPKLFELYRKKYAKLNVNLLHVKKSLVFFDDADPEPEPHLLKPVSWDAVKARFRAEVLRLGP